MKKSTNFELLIAKIVAKYGCKEEVVLDLIKITNDMSSGAKYASIGDYSSDKSEHTEVAKHKIIIGYSYENMKKEDKKVLNTFNVNSVDIDKFNYDSIDLNGKDINVFKNEVRQNMNTALDELKNPKEKVGVDNNEWLNDVLVFNWNTERLCISGQEVEKTIIVKGEYKKTKSVPKTIAKNLIKKQANLRADKIRKFAIDNLSEVKLNGETLEIQ